WRKGWAGTDMAPIGPSSALDRHDHDVAEDEAADEDEGRRDGAERAHATAEDVEQERHDQSRSDEAAPEQRPQVAAGDRLRSRAQHAEEDREHEELDEHREAIRHLDLVPALAHRAAAQE